MLKKLAISKTYQTHQPNYFSLVLVGYVKMFVEHRNTYKQYSNIRIYALELRGLNSKRKQWFKRHHMRFKNCFTTVSTNSYTTPKP
jgi:hypothetical protein